MGEGASICMLLTNPCVNDSRVLREARALAEAGYDLRILATDAPGAPLTERRDGFEIVRLPGDPRLANVIRKAVGRARLLTSRFRPARDGAQPENGGEGEAAIVAQGPWMAAAGGESDRSLLLRHPRAAAVRLTVRTFLTLRWWRFARAAWAAIREAPADIYFAHDLDTLPIAALARARLGGAIVYDSHELYTDQSISPPQSALARARWRLCERRLIRKADAVITVCESIADELATRYGIARPTVVRNIPELAGAGGSDPEGLRSRLGIDSAARVAIYLGGIQLNRRLEHLIDAIGPLPDDVVLVLMGPGDPAYVDYLRAYAERVGYPERVRVTGPVAPELVADTTREADLGLVVLQRSSLSDWYCLPSKLFESIQAGIPVVANDWPELRRVVEGYGVGILCDSGEPAAIRAAMRRLLEDRETYERMKENARRASRELTWQEESKRLLEVIPARGGGS